MPLPAANVGIVLSGSGAPAALAFAAAQDARQAGRAEIQGSRGMLDHNGKEPDLVEDDDRFMVHLWA